MSACEALCIRPCTFVLSWISLYSYTVERIGKDQKNYNGFLYPDTKKYVGHAKPNAGRPAHTSMLRRLPEELKVMVCLVYVSCVCRVYVGTF